LEKLKVHLVIDGIADPVFLLDRATELRVIELDEARDLVRQRVARKVAPITHKIRLEGRKKNLQLPAFELKYSSGAACPRSARMNPGSCRSVSMRFKNDPNDPKEKATDHLHLVSQSPVPHELVMENHQGSILYFPRAGKRTWDRP
jgi:hypothetical protein